MRLDIQRFASGTIDGSSTASRCDCQIVWSSTSNGSSANSSNVTATIQILKTGSGTTTGTFSGTITINGTNYNVSKKFSPYTYGNWATVGSATAIVPHNDNGTKTITISGKLTQSGTTMAGTYTANGSATLDTIPRASTIISTSGNTLGSGMSVTYNSKANFTTKAFFKFANSGWDYVGELWGSGDKTISFTPTIATYAPYWTTSNKSTAYIKIITYDGTTQIGEEVVSSEFDVNIPIQNPSITGINITDTTGLKNTYGSYIKGKSICRVEANASGIYGSWITGYSITIGTSKGSNQALETVTTIAGERPIRVRVTDSRGNSVEQTSSINVLDYQNPSIYTLTAERNNENESIINVNFSGGVTTLDGNNSAYFTLKYKQTSQSSWTTYYTWSEYNPNKSLIIEGIDSNSSYEILLEANDNFSNSTKTVQVGTSFALINFSSGGRGMAIGKASESENLFEVGMDMNVTGEISTNTIFSGENGNYYHAIDIGHPNKDRCNFHEYGGEFNFYKNQGGKWDTGQLIAQITDRGLWAYGNITADNFRWDNMGYSDWNGYIYNGVYQVLGGDGANSPYSGGKWGTLIVSKGKGTNEEYVQQIFIPNYDTAMGRIYIRSCVSNENVYNWTSWRGIGSDNYSTNEQIAGIWINGKPLYKKTISYYEGLNNGTENVLYYGITNIEDIVDYKAVMKRRDDSYQILPVVHTDQSWQVSLYDFTREWFRCRIGDLHGATSFESLHLTLYYTKTID